MTSDRLEFLALQANGPGEGFTEAQICHNAKKTKRKKQNITSGRV
jgi:hypothetical protein